ncbi:TIGR00730 family Rossman fold protein [Singulisphaera sp. PoT]|uniref:LOG family protein n=1 Tax=Singulisphaera sp. PoT TaxID=3411797 RepID=UPI003BF52D0A
MKTAKSETPSILPTSYVCVFCGSLSGSRPAYEAAARCVGTAIAEKGLGLVYGGGRVGLMGIVADAALEAGGRVIGIIPERLSSSEIAHGGLSELHVVNSMHERKAMMAMLSSGFLTLPGGIGTFEEFFEILTWSALKIHGKPMGILNVDGYFDRLFDFMNYGVEEGFIRKRDREKLVVSDDPESLIAYFAEHVRPPQSEPVHVERT